MATRATDLLLPPIGALYSLGTRSRLSNAIKDSSTSMHNPPHIFRPRVTHDCATILDSIAKKTSCSQDFSHGTSLHQHSFSRMIFYTCNIVICSQRTTRTKDGIVAICDTVCLFVYIQGFNCSIAIHFCPALSSSFPAPPSLSSPAVFLSILPFVLSSLVTSAAPLSFQAHQSFSSIDSSLSPT